MMNQELMISEALNIIIQAITACLGWFDSIFEATGSGKFYIAMVFIAMACGYLLSFFSVGIGVGSDTAANDESVRKFINKRFPHKDRGSSKSSSRRRR